MELFIGAAVCLVLLIAVQIYLRWFHAGTVRDVEFERWCAGGATLLAFQTLPGGARGVIRTLREAIDGAPGREVANRHGPWPWQSYLVTVEAVERGDIVVVVTRSARLARGRRRNVDIEAIWRSVLRDDPERVDGVWLAAALHAPRASHRPDGWHVGADGDPVPAIHRPAWL